MADIFSCTFEGTKVWEVRVIADDDSVTERFIQLQHKAPLAEAKAETGRSRDDWWAWRIGWENMCEELIARFGGADRDDMLVTSGYDTYIVNGTRFQIRIPNNDPRDAPDFDPRKAPAFD
jgi:hypothetical protein